MINRSGKFTKQKAKYKGKLHEDYWWWWWYYKKRGEIIDTKKRQSK